MILCLLQVGIGFAEDKTQEQIYMEGMGSEIKTAENLLKIYEVIATFL